MRASVACLLALGLTACASKVEVQVNDMFPGKAARQILAHADSASVDKVLHDSYLHEVKPVGRAGRNAMVKALLHFRPDTTGGYSSFCGGHGFGAEPKPIYDISFQAKSAKFGTLTLKTEYGCAVVPRLVVAPARGKPKTLKVMGGDSEQALYHIYQGVFPGASPTSGGCCG